jgi:alpha-N-acetylglucosaminidase
MLDLWAEVQPIWPQTDSFFGTPFVWCMLHNFGGRTGLYGRLDAVASAPLQARAQTPYMVGVGMAPEAIENNPVMYELMAVRASVRSLHAPTAG